MPQQIESAQWKIKIQPQKMGCKRRRLMSMRTSSDDVTHSQSKWNAYRRSDESNRRSRQTGGEVANSALMASTLMMDTTMMMYVSKISNEKYVY